MSPDEIERTIQFLLTQQAQVAADFAASQARWDSTFEKLSNKTDRVVEGLRGLTSVVGQLAATQQRTEQELKEADLRLSEHIKSVESHLNLVIEMFERHLREDHGGPPS